MKSWVVGNWKLNPASASAVQALVDDLVDIWNIIGTSYVINFPYLILADGLLEKINTHLSTNDVKLTKKWYSYKTKISNRF